MIQVSHQTDRCGIVLAAGEGQRLQSFIRRLRGDALPKQFVNFIGTRSMLQHTYARAEMLISPARLFTVVSRSHLDYPEVASQISSRAHGAVIEQPENKDTGPGLLLPLMHVARRHPESVVVIFPSDHFVVEEELFMSHVDHALRVVERYSSVIVLLGIEPDQPELEYGYIVPGGEESHLAPLGLRNVARFIEKPDGSLLDELLHAGSLWNTMVMAFQVKTMLRLIQRTVPLMYAAFQQIAQAIDTRYEEKVIREVYQQIQVMNLSRGLLEAHSQESAIRLQVLPVGGVCWSDWGSEQRILSMLKKLGYSEKLQSADLSMRDVA
jgi:mannose-1-phosphate guanylyltransferase